MQKLVVRQGNDLIDASYKIASLGEARLMRLLIAQISPNDEDFKTYHIAVADFARVFGLDSQDGRLYGRVNGLLYKAADALTSRKVSISKGKGWLLTNWLSSAEYKEESGYIELCFDVKLKPYLLQLKSYYTEYDIQEENTVHFKSLYSVRLFELIKKESFKSSKDGYFKRTFEYEELREKMAIEKTEYSLFADFRVNVIEKAQKEINKYSSLNIIQIDYPKTGRKITHIVFHVEKQKQGSLILEGASPVVTEVKKKDETPEDILELVSMGITEETAYKWRKKYGAKQLVRNIAYTRAMQKANKIKTSLSGYVAKAIADDMASGWQQEQEKTEARKKEQITKAQEEKETAADKEEKQTQEILSALEIFWTLPENKQESMRLAFAASFPTKTQRDIWEKTRKKAARPEESKAHRLPFVEFIKTRGQAIGNE